MACSLAIHPPPPHVDDMRQMGGGPQSFDSRLCYVSAMLRQQTAFLPSAQSNKTKTKLVDPSPAAQ